MEKPILLYGLQRSGTNYLQYLIPENFKAELKIDFYTYSLPIHKHFRPYDEHHFVPHLNHIHNFTYPHFDDFDKHCQRLLNTQGLCYLVISKEPYSWYLSFCRHAKREKMYTLLQKKYDNPQYMIDYSLFFKKWLNFREQAPEKIMIVRYEDLLHDFEGTMEKIGDKFDFEKLHPAYKNLDKVGMSKKFTPQKRARYMAGEFHKDFRDEQLLVLSEHLDRKVVRQLGYEVHYPRGIQPPE